MTGVTAGSTLEAPLAGKTLTTTGPAMSGPIVENVQVAGLLIPMNLFSAASWKVFASIRTR